MFKRKTMDTHAKFPQMMHHTVLKFSEGNERNMGCQ